MMDTQSEFLNKILRFERPAVHQQFTHGLALWHWGHNSGYRAYMISYPRRELAVVYFTNSDNGMRFLGEVISAATGDEEHPAIDHLDYPQLGSEQGEDTKK